MLPSSAAPSAVLLGSALLVATAAAGLRRPRELGDVGFLRDLDQALAESGRSGRPVLILFDEVPGCHTCTSYGDTVLRHPLLVETIESAFIPVAIYNNEKGKDAEVLAHFGEPSWNNPVVRVVSQDRSMLAPRLAGDYSLHGLARVLRQALEAGGRPVPAHLRLLEEEEGALAQGTGRVALAMYCFWAGEACLGDLEGVVESRAGFLDGREVVELRYDPARTSLGRLLEAARARRCGTRVYVTSADELAQARAVFGDDAALAPGAVRPSEKDDKYNLAATPWRSVPMTGLQASRANSLLAAGRDPAPLFSARQRAIYARAQRQALPEVFRERDLRAAFERAER